MAREFEAVRARLRSAGWLTNGIGVLTVAALEVGFLMPIFLDGGERGRFLLLNGSLGIIAFVLIGLAVDYLSNRYNDEALGWAIEGRPPEERELRLTLSIPAYGAKVTALGWAFAVVAFAAINTTFSLEIAAGVGAALWLGGETTSALAYLLQERIMRPLTARALTARLPAEPLTYGVRGRLLIAWLGTAVPLLGIVLIAIVGLTKSDVDTAYLAAAGLFLGLVTLGVGLLATVFAARALADPVAAVRSGLERIERGDLDAQVRVDDGSELGLLQAGFNRMAEGLRERERIRDLFGRQVGHDVAAAALRDRRGLGGEEREIGALFVDLVGSTSLAATMPPKEVVALLNRFFGIVIDVRQRAGSSTSWRETRRSASSALPPPATIRPARRSAPRAG